MNHQLLRTGIIAIFLFASTSQALFAKSNSFSRLGKEIQPELQKINITADPDAEGFHGYTEVHLKINKPVNTIRFHAKELELADIQLKSGNKIFKLQATRPNEDLVELRLLQKQLPGQAILSMRFKGEYNKNSVGLYKMKADGLNYLSSQFEMQDARRAFPSWDEPGFKFPYQLNISAPVQHEIISNTPVANEQSDNGIKTLEFMQTRPLPSYLVAIIVGPYEKVSVADMPVPANIYTTRGQLHLAELAAAYTPKILNALETYFGRPYPYRKLDQVAVPVFPFGAMENAGAITYRDDILLADTNSASLNTRYRLTSVIAHEIAHQWFGNLVTMYWWSDLWLNEAFASWMAGKIIEEEFPEFNSQLSIAKTRVMKTDARPSTLPVRKPIQSEADIMDGLGLNYSKGKTLLDMVEDWVTEDIFRQAVRTHLNDNAFANASAEDLWQAFSDTSGKDVQSVLSSFLDQAGFPLLNIRREGRHLRISQKRFLNEGVEAAEQQWQLPVRITAGYGDRQETFVFELNNTEKAFSLPENPDWLFADTGVNGYYLWNMPRNEMVELARRSEAIMSARERKGFIANSSSLMDAGNINVSDFLAILRDFSNDPQAEVLIEVTNGLARIRDFLVNADNRPAFRQFVNQLLDPALVRFGEEPRKDENPVIEKLRPYLLIWLGRYADREDIRLRALAKVKAHLEQGTPLNPANASVLLMLAAMQGDKDLFEALASAHKTAATPRLRTAYLRALGSFRQDDLRTRALEYALSEHVQPADMSYLVSAMKFDDRGKAVASAWLYKKHEQIAAKIPPFVLGSLPGWQDISCQADKLHKAEQFYLDPARRQEGMKRTLIKMQDALGDCLRFRQRESTHFEAFLAATKGTQP